MDSLTFLFWLAAWLLLELLEPAIDVLLPYCLGFCGGFYAAVNLNHSTRKTIQQAFERTTRTMSALLVKTDHLQAINPTKPVTLQLPFFDIRLTIHPPGHGPFQSFLREHDLNPFSNVYVAATFKAEVELQEELGNKGKKGFRSPKKDPKKKRDEREKRLRVEKRSEAMEHAFQTASDLDFDAYRPSAEEIAEGKLRLLSIIKDWDVTHPETGQPVPMTPQLLLDNAFTNHTDAEGNSYIITQEMTDFDGSDVEIDSDYVGLKVGDAHILFVLRVLKTWKEQGYLVVEEAAKKSIDGQDISSDAGQDSVTESTTIDAESSESSIALVDVPGTQSDVPVASSS